LCAVVGKPQPTEWQRIRNQIDAAMIFARTDFVCVHHQRNHGRIIRRPAIQKSDSGVNLLQPAS